MNATVQRLCPAPGQRVVALSDVHGNLDFLKGLFQKIDLSSDDLLVLCGDLVEKGPHSLATLRLLLDLSRRIEVRGVIGNCDFGVLMALESEEERTQEWFRHCVQLRTGRWGSLLLEMMQEQGMEFLPQGDLRPIIRRLNAAYREELAFLRGLPTVLSAPRHLFVHAGLPTQDEAKLSAHPLSACVKVDDFMASASGFSKWVIVGHWPVSLYREDFPRLWPIVDKARHIISIDGGCVLKSDGQLNALLFSGPDGEDFSFAAYDGLPLARALDAQEESARSFHLRWTDNEVEILRRWGDCARIRHLRTGYEMDVPASLLLTEGPPARCLDATDYQLAVRPGEVLSVLDAAPCALGWRVKRDGVSGWYRGRLSFL